jgi:hypothetical protein
MPGNLNVVVRQATGDLIANLHDADEYHPTLLEKWEAALLRNSSAGLVFCGLDGARKPGGDGRVWIHEFPELTGGKEFFSRVYAGSAGSPIWGTVMVRREVYERHLPFDPQFRNWADVDMWMRICSTHDISYVAEPLIILDNSPTPVRRFSWSKFLIIHRMPALNIFRMTVAGPERNAWLARQKSCTRRLYLRSLAGRLLHGEIMSFANGLAYFHYAIYRIFKKDLRFTETGRLRLHSCSNAKPQDAVNCTA